MCKSHTRIILLREHFSFPQQIPQLCYLHTFIPMKTFRTNVQKEIKSFECSKDQKKKKVLTSLP